MAPRAATRDAARVLGYDYATGDRLAKQIPEPIMGRSPSFEECLKAGEELQAHLRLRRGRAEDPRRRAQGLEGIVRNNSIHAAAVVIADRPLHGDRAAAARRGPRRRRPSGSGNGKPERAYKTVTQYSMGPIEEIGLLKMDFLGLRNLDVIEDAVEIIERSRGDQIDIEAIPLDDPQDLRDARARRVGRRLPVRVRGHAGRARDVRPTEFNDIVALVALYRPGAMRFIPDYANGKRDPASVRYPDARLRPITEPTYGCCIYQEQLMEIAKQIGRLQPGRGRRPAQGGRQEEARPDGHDEGRVPRRAAPRRTPIRASPRTSGR